MSDRVETITGSTSGRCCCGRTYAEGGGASNYRCPVGKRSLCQECVTKGKDQCPTHKVKSDW